MRLDDPDLLYFTPAKGSTCSNCLRAVEAGEESILVLLTEEWLLYLGETDFPPGWHVFHVGANGSSGG